MKKCSPKGRDCIERNSARSFNCSATCEGIYADVQWVDERMEGDLEDELANENVEKKLKGKHDEEMYDSITEMKRMLKDMRKEMIDQKGRIGKRGEEMDKEKFLTLISEYKRLKMNNVQHFRFNSAANLTNFGKF